ncbi:MAG: cupin domain-containing protein [Beijerinckiaceae bacterium]
MHVTRLSHATPYEMPGHHGMRMSRLQGRDAGPSDTMWIGMSQIEPGGHIEPSSAPQERFYIILEGEVEIGNGIETHTLRKWDSCRIGPNETRIVHNKTSLPAVTLLAMALPEQK